MRQTPRLFRLTAGVAVSALFWDAVLPLAAFAQQAASPPPATAAAQPDQNQGDPPARVGRLAMITGSVSFHNQGDTSWSAASLNYPVTTGNSFWTEPNAMGELEISDSRLVLAGATELTVTALDAARLQAVESQGEMYLRLRDLAPHEVWSIQTPRGQVQLTGAGRYDIVVGTTNQPTLVTVLEGSAQIEAPGLSLTVNANQTATIAGTDPFQGSIGAAVRTAFLNARLEAERPRAAPPAAVPQQVVAMAGGSDLVSTGSWSSAPEYGQVWYPPVSAGWVPYREGHWAYVAPWGWTWIDNAPWGFAPFHYGRWVEISGRWAWTPGAAAVSAPPVYAPALVAFVGLGAGVAIGAALASGTIGWVPLGPREPYQPWYHASPNYVRQINVMHVTNINNNNVTINNFVNRGAATSVPAGVMTGSQPVQAAARPITPQEFGAARPIIGAQPLRPTASTVGVTPVVARQLNVAPAAMAHPAPGPAVRVQAPGAAGGRPPLPGAGASGPGERPATNAVAEPNRQGGQPMTPEVGHPGILPVPGQGHPGLPAEAGRPPGVPESPVGNHPGQPGQAARPVNVPEPPLANHQGQPAQAAHPGSAETTASRPGVPAETARPANVLEGTPNRPGTPAQAERPASVLEGTPNRPGTPAQAERPANVLEGTPNRPGAPAQAERPASVLEGTPNRPGAPPARAEVARPASGPGNVPNHAVEVAPRPSAAPYPAAEAPRPAPQARPEPVRTVPQARPAAPPRPVAEPRPAPRPEPAAHAANEHERRPGQP